MKYLLCFLGLSITFFQSALYAQKKECRVRGGVNLTIPVTSRIDVRVNHQRTYEASDRFENRFNSTGIRGSYEVNKRLDAYAGIVILQSARSNTTRSKVFARIRHTTKLGDFRWRNALQVETFSKNQDNFRHRVILNTSIGLRERMEILNISPAIGYSLYYNIGGEKIQYYNEDKQPAIKQSPDGFHRGRFFVNLNSRLNKHISLTVGYFNQHEFNLLTSDYRRINVVKPNGKITRRFNNYNAVNCTLNLTIGRNGTKPLFK